MPSLEDSDSSTVWEDAEGLIKTELSNLTEIQCGDWVQCIRLAKGIEYIHGNNNTRLRLNLAVCHKMWEESYVRSK